MTPEEYLISIGIELQCTTLIVHIEGSNRQPDLVRIMEDYYLAKKKEEEKPT
jgi:hypothetical protein